MLKPTIGYGTFDRNGHEAQPGETGYVRAGYGILNPPRNFYGTVTDSADDPDLHSFHNVALEIWNHQRIIAEFHALPNKWELFVGRTFERAEVTSRDFSFRLADLGWVYASYGATSLHLGIVTRDQLPGMFPAVLESVEFDEATHVARLNFTTGSLALVPMFFADTATPPSWKECSDHIIKAVMPQT